MHNKKKADNYDEKLANKKLLPCREISIKTQKQQFIISFKCIVEFIFWDIKMSNNEKMNAIVEQ